MVKNIQIALTRVRDTKSMFDEAKSALDAARLELMIRKAELWSSGKLNGRNELEREAQLLLYAKDDFLKVYNLETKVDGARLEYQLEKLEWETWAIIIKYRDEKQKPPPM